MGEKATATETAIEYAVLIRLFGTMAGGNMKEADQLVEQCLSEYDVDGWTGDTWFEADQ